MAYAKYPISNSIYYDQLRTYIHQKISDKIAATLNKFRGAALVGAWSGYVTEAGVGAPLDHELALTGIEPPEAVAVDPNPEDPLQPVQTVTVVDQRLTPNGSDRVGTDAVERSGLAVIKGATGLALPPPFVLVLNELVCDTGKSVPTSSTLAVVLVSSSTRPTSTTAASISPFTLLQQGYYAATTLLGHSRVCAPHCQQYQQPSCVHVLILKVDQINLMLGARPLRLGD